MDATNEIIKSETPIPEKYQGIVPKTAAPLPTVEAEISQTPHGEPLFNGFTQPQIVNYPLSGTILFIS